MFHVVLVNPEIPPNTGNVIRLCANTGAQLHLIEPLGFPLDDSKMKRAGLDYHDYATMKVHKDWSAFIEDTRPDPARMFALTTHGSSPFADAAFRPGDVFVFGSETRGDSQAPAVDLTVLHAKIGELTLENDFLEGALGKAGLLSAKR